VSLDVFIYPVTFTSTFSRINRARGRVIPKQRAEGVLMHRTIKMRMELVRNKEGKPYKPRAKLIPGIEPTWVD